MLIMHVLTDVCCVRTKSPLQDSRQAVIYVNLYHAAAHCPLYGSQGLDTMYQLF